MLDTPTDTLLVNRRNLPFTLDNGIAQRAAIGLVVLATDQTIEHEWRQMLRLDGVAFYESRIYNAPTITPETLAEMEGGIPGAAADMQPREGRLGKPVTASNHDMAGHALRLAGYAEPVAGFGRLFRM